MHKKIMKRIFQRVALSVCLGGAMLASAPNWVTEVQADPFQPLRTAWSQGRDAGKPVMLVLGADWCDRCALLERYMADQALQQRIDSQFVVLNLDVGSPDSLISFENSEQRLPVIVLLDSDDEFERLLQSDSLMTFLPEPYEPLYDWLENILFYTEQTLAAR